MSDILPKVRIKKLDAKYTLTISSEMKRRLDELKSFEGVDVPTWIRSMIEASLKHYDKKRQSNGN